MKGSINVNVGKRGTTIRATGSAAQAVFDALTAKPEPVSIKPGDTYTTIEFEDQGQDFLRWHVEEKTGKAFDCEPCQKFMWVGVTVALEKLKIGGKVLFTRDLVTAKTIKYPIKSIVSGRIWPEASVMAKPASVRGPLVDPGQVVMFTVRERSGSWTTSRVRGLTGNSTSSRMAAASRLADRLRGDAPYLLEQVGDCDEKHVYTYRLVLRPQGQTPPSELDRAGGAS